MVGWWFPVVIADVEAQGVGRFITWLFWRWLVFEVPVQTEVLNQAIDSLLDLVDGPPAAYAVLESQAQQ